MLVGERGFVPLITLGVKGELPIDRYQQPLLFLAWLAGGTRRYV